MQIGAAVETFLAHRHAKRLSENSLSRYAQALQRWQRWRSTQPLTSHIRSIAIEDLRAFFTYLLDEHIPHSDNPRRRASLTPGLAPATVLSTRNVLRAFWMFAAGEGWLRDDQKDFFRGDRIPRPIVEVEDRPFWSDELVDRLLGAGADLSTEERTRNQAMVLLFFESGMRLDELSRIEVGVDFLLDERAARIMGKGRKRRWIFWHDRADAAIRAYVALRPGPMEGALFRGASRVNHGGPMTRDAIRALIKKMAKQAGVELPKQAPIHAGRHGFAHAMIDGGAEISELAQMMGHSDLNTTYRYVRERRDRLQEVHRKAHNKRLQSRIPRTHNR